MVSLEQKVEAIVEWISEKKGERIVSIDVSKKASFTDYFVICTGNGEMHTQAIAENVLERGKQAKYHLLGKEGLGKNSWILLDYGDVIVHIFDEPIREHYKLEDLWAKMPVREDIIEQELEDSDGSDGSDS